MKETDKKKNEAVSGPSALLSENAAEFSEVDLLRWIAQQSADPNEDPGDYSDRITAAYGQKSGE